MDLFSGGGGGKQQQVVTQSLSPEQQAALQWYQGQLHDAVGQLRGGNLGYFTDPNNNPYQLNPGQLQAINQLQGAAGALPPDPLSNPALGAYAAGVPQWLGHAQGGLDQWMNIANSGANKWLDAANTYGSLFMQPINAGSMPSTSINYQANPLSEADLGGTVQMGTQAPVSTARIDPTGAIQAAKNQLETISSPAIRNALQAAGLGRSGAEGEALAEEGTRLELPIQQEVLQTDAAANQLDAQIKARQQEVTVLGQLQAALQHQSLKATSAMEAQQINAQIAQVQAQLQEKANEMQFMGNLQAQIAQRQNMLGFATSTLGQGANMFTNLTGQGAGLFSNLMGQGTNILGQEANLGAVIPALQSQHYMDMLTGAQTNLGAASLGQQADISKWNNLQNFILSLMGQTPMPSGGTVSTSTTQNPGIFNVLGNVGLIGSLLK